VWEPEAMKKSHLQLLSKTCSRRHFVAALGLASGHTIFRSNPAAAALSKMAQPVIVVSHPTGAAIQAAIDSLPDGGTIYLTAAKPYVIGATLVISTNGINLVGLGSKRTTLLAEHGAVLTVSYHAEEQLLLVQGANNVSISGLKVDTRNEDNTSELRQGISVWNSNAVQITDVSFVRNLGPNAFNRGLAFEQSSNVTASKCVVSQSRDGIFVWECNNFNLTECSVHDCEVLGSNFTGVVSGINLINDTSGNVSSCSISHNTVPGGMFVTNCENIVIENCTVSETLPYPGQPGNDGIFIELSPTGPITVQNCKLIKNSGAGVSAQGSSNVTIQGCVAQNSGTLGLGGSGISINGGTETVQITGNTVSDTRNPSYGGIVAGFSSDSDIDCTVSHNVVHGLAQGVALGPSSSNFTVEFNDLTQNATCVLDQGTDNTILDNSC
jgi:parallel beta-helix repeat protein